MVGRSGSALGRGLLALAAASALATAGPALAASYAVSIDIRAGSLEQALQDLARQSGLELLYDRNLTAGLRSDAVRGRLTPEATLQRLLAGTTLTVRRAQSGALIVEPAAAPPLARQDVAVSEVLVIGTRSQNVDIRRQESDIQPYRVAPGGVILDADRDNLDQYFRSRVPDNAVTLPPSLDVKGETTSEIDLRGVGSNGTLVLLDGRRMPSIPAPSPSLGFRQPDLNALPLHAIDRVEILTGSAGGIHGFGALGGVVNVVLARRPHGAELHATGGVTSRGDARQLTLEGRIGFSPDDGRTEVTLYASSSRSDPLLTGQRRYLDEDAKLTAANDPVDLLGLRPTANSVFVRSSDNTKPFILKPQYGGATLGASYTFLPGGLSGAPGEVAGALVQNAGQFDAGLSEGEARSGLGSNARTGAVLANVRHRFGGGVEAYLDAVVLWDRGRFVSHKFDNIDFLSATSPFNPFTQNVQLAYPVAGAGEDKEVRFDSARYTAGLVAPLPFDWRATADLALGSAHYEYVQTVVAFQSFPTPVGAPPLNPFGDWNALQAALMAYLKPSSNQQKITNHFRELSLRLAGPLFETAAGATTLTLLAERRAEEVPAYVTLAVTPTSTTASSFASHDSRTTSFYAELRSPLIDEAASVPLLRGLEAQLAIRNDTERDDFSRDPRLPEPTGRMRASFSGTVYTAGAKVSPARWLMLRASYATGETPPPLADLVETVGDYRTLNVGDPKRGNLIVANGARFVYLFGGSAELKTVRANTLSFGGRLSLFGEGGPLLTVDYSRIRKSGDVFRFPFQGAQLVFDHEEAWPERLIRGPLSDADRALGYTAGPLILVDARADNAAGLTVETIDARFEWSLPVRGGRLQLYGDGTYYIRNVSTAPFQADLDRVDYLSGPLERRANLGANWSRGPLKLGANLQYFGSYRIYPPGTLAFAANTATALQGRVRVPSQAYLDLHAGWRHRLPAGSLAEAIQIELGVVNVFDKTPPRESSYSLSQFPQFIGTSFGHPGYSRFGDPRQRRFLLTVSAAF